MITLELTPEIIAKSETIPLELLTETANGWTTTRCLNEAGTLLAEAKQQLSPKHLVRFFQGKGGFSAIVESKDGLVYIGLPGSRLDLGDTVVDVPGKPLTGKNATMIYTPDKGEIQTVTHQAMILGAGLATRFEPVSGDTTGYPKPGVPLIGDISVIKAIALHLKNHGFTKLLINTYYRPECLKQQLDEISGMEICYIDEDAPSGTAGGLAKALKSGMVDPEKPILIVQGDAVTDCHFSFLLNKHVEKNAAVTIGGQIVPDEMVSSFGIIQTDGSGGDGQSGHIVKFLEKPSLEKAGSSRFANTGFYVISPETFPLFASLYDDCCNRSVLYDYAQDCFPAVLLATENQETRCRFSNKPMSFWAQAMGGYWSDIGNPAQYIEAAKDVAEGRVKIQLPENISDYYEDGIIYWPDTKKLTTQNGAKLTGNVVVAKPIK